MNIHYVKHKKDWENSKTRQSEQQKDKKIEKTNEESLRDLWDSIKENNIHIRGFKDKKKWGQKTYFLNHDLGLPWPEGKKHTFIFRKPGVFQIR